MGAQPHFEMVKVSAYFVILSPTFDLTFSSCLYITCHLSPIIHLEHRVGLVNNQSFADVPITPTGIDSKSFLEASEGLLQMFGTSLTTLLFLSSAEEIEPRQRLLFLHPSHLSEPSSSISC